MTPAARRALRAAGRCYDCGGKARPRRTRCLGCARAHGLKQRERRGVVELMTCPECGGEGHNRRTCEAAPTAA